MNIIVANKVTFLYFVAVVLLAIFVCGQSVTVALAQRQPSTSISLIDDYCPSMDVQTGTYITWTNLGDVDRLLIFERVNEEDETVGAGGISFLQVADTFTTSFRNPGEYRYYCSEDRSISGTITVFQ